MLQYQGPYFMCLVYCVTVSKLIRNNYDCAIPLMEKYLASRLFI
jgi:hypothetical protein